jgi:[ribosomal protein S18]-alanine N-acetyltransferase
VNDSQYTIREAVLGDIAALRNLDLQTGRPVGRSDSDYSSSSRSSPFKRVVVVLAQAVSKDISGFLVMRAVDNDWELENIVIAADERRRGCAHRLLEHAIAFAAGAGATRLTLEVRASNEPAIALYKKCGFQQDGARKNYYSAPTEDALLFSLSLRNSS